MKVCKEEESDITSKDYRLCQFSIADFLEELDGGKYGSVTNEIKDLMEKRMNFLKPFYAMIPDSPRRGKSFIKLENDVIKLENDQNYHGVIPADPILVIDSDEEEPRNQRPCSACKDVPLNSPVITSVLVNSKVPCAVF